MTLTDQERDKYQDYWKLEAERKRSPGMRAIDGFIQIAERAGWRSVLDIGCGTGRTAATLLDAGFDVMATDIAANCLNGDLKDKLADRFVTAPAWNLPFDDDQFDVIFCCDVLEHIPTELVEVTLSEMGRVAPWLYAEIASFNRTVGYKKQPLKVHLTVEPIEYWLEQMERVGYEILRAGDRKEGKPHKTPGYEIWARTPRLGTGE